LEMPATTSGVAYAAGFALMSALLHCAGLGLGQYLRRGPSLQTLRWSGAAMAVCGLVLLVAK